MDFVEVARCKLGKNIVILKYGVKISETQIKSMESSYLILRNVDFVAKYFPFFLQTSIRSGFKLQISYPRNLHFVYNNLKKRKNSTTQEEREMFRMLAEPLSPRVLDTLSCNTSSIHTDNRNSYIEGILALTSV
jgi:hypothetical protein